MVLIRDVKSPRAVHLALEKKGGYLENRNLSYLKSEYVRLTAVFSATAVLWVSVALDINSKSR
jgi:hypothetical protein